MRANTKIAALAGVVGIAVGALFGSVGAHILERNNPNPNNPNPKECYTAGRNDALLVSRKFFSGQETIDDITSQLFLLQMDRFERKGRINCSVNPPTPR